MYKLALVISLCTFSALNSYSQEKIDRHLTEKLKELTAPFHGEVGIYVENLTRGKVAILNADTIFPTASMIKIPIMCGVFNKIELGDLAYNQKLIYKDSLLYPGEDILGSFKDGSEIYLNKVQMLSITTSDNTASLWLQTLAGGDSINSWLQSNGFAKTRLNSKIIARKLFRERYGWGQTTPREMANLLTRISKGEVISREASERMYRNLSHIYWDEEALSQIPPYIQTASKQGAVDQSRSEVVFVNAPHSKYVFCIITKNQKDTSWTSDNEGFKLIRDLSSLLWNYFEPKSTWKPTTKINKFSY